MEYVKHIKTNEIYEFISFVQKEVQCFSYVNYSSHVRVKDSKNLVRYFPINLIEFVETEKVSNREVVK